MRTARLALTAVLVVGTAVAVAESPANAASGGSTTVHVDHSRIMKGESYAAYGQVKGGSGPRPVKLQYKSGDTWKTYATTGSSSEGYFGVLVLESTKTRTIRYYAPASGSKKAVKGTSRTITVVSQSARAHAFPAEICQSSTKKIRVEATFSPVRKDREIGLTYPSSLLLGQTDSKGRFITGDITVDNSSIGTKHVTLEAGSYDGSAAKKVQASYRVIACA